MTTKVRCYYVVVCADYTSPRYETREQAERWKEAVEAEGHCKQTHDIEERFTTLPFKYGRRA